MSDEALREAERRWRATGHVEDEARLLLEQLRAGQLSAERLELAAYCGHGAALVAIGRPVGDPAVTNVKRWVASVPRGRDVVAWRAAVAALDAAGPVAAERVLDCGPGGPTLAALVVAVQRWLLDPTTSLASPLPDHGLPMDGRDFERPPAWIHAQGIVGDAADFVGHAELLARLRAEIGTWALGRGDPVRDRAARRPDASREAPEP